MSADNRTVATDALATLGTIHGAPLPRDAIHLAVIQMQAPCSLMTGEHIDKDGQPVNNHYGEGAIGIVDPFLPKYRVSKGEFFWCVIYPRVITSLRHVWAHPAFSDEAVTQGYAVGAPVADKAARSEAWLREWCGANDTPGWDTIRAILESGTDDDDDVYPTTGYVDRDYFHISGRDAHATIPPEFWDHVENVIGRVMKMRPGYFSCSC